MPPIGGIRGEASAGLEPPGHLPRQQEAVAIAQIDTAHADSLAPAYEAAAPDRLAEGQVAALPRTVSPAQTKVARPRRSRFRPKPQSSSQDAGFGGACHALLRMSQRTPILLDIAHPMFPDGDWKVATESGEPEA